MGRPVSDNLIKSGPQKLINNVIKISKLTDAFVLNKHISENYYFINFDENNFLTIEKILQDKNSKVIVGPLYNQKDLKILAKLSLQYNNLKIVVASSSAKEDLEQITGLSVSNQVSILPVGVYSESEIFNFQNQRKLIDNYQFDCLIYFKNRELKSLNEIINFFSDIDLKTNVGDFRLFSRRAIDKILKVGDYEPYLRGVSVWVGYKQVIIPYERQARFSGSTHFSLLKFNSFLRGPLNEFLKWLTSFSNGPLYFIFFNGLIISFLSIIFIIYGFIIKFFNLSMTGVPGIIILISFFFGILFLNMGIFGLYLAKIFDQTKNRPRYIIDNIIKKKNSK